MANDFVHGGVQLAGEFAVRLDAHQLRVVVDKLLEHAASCSLVVCIDNVAKRHRLGPVHLTDPVAVGEIHPNGRAG